MKQVAIISVVCLGLIGCGLMNAVTGTNSDGTPSGGPNILESAGGILGLLIPGATGIVGFASGWITKAYRHSLLVKAGKKDDDFDGIEDAPDVVKPTSPDSSSPRAL